MNKVLELRTELRDLHFSPRMQRRTNDRQSWTKLLASDLLYERKPYLAYYHRDTVFCIFHIIL